MSKRRTYLPKNPDPLPLKEFIGGLNGDHYALTDSYKVAGQVLYWTKGEIWRVVLPDGELAIAIRIPGEEKR